MTWLKRHSQGETVGIVGQCAPVMPHRYADERSELDIVDPNIAGQIELKVRGCGIVEPGIRQENSSGESGQKPEPVGLWSEKKVKIENG